MDSSREIRPVRRPIDRRIRLPGSKSLTNRALVAAALADGPSTLSGALFADDTRLMIDALAALGVETKADPQREKILVSGCNGHWPECEADVYCGNAGTVIRFLTAACAAGRGRYLFDGDARMRQRPIGDLVRALVELGAAVAFAGAQNYPPVSVQPGSLRGGAVRIERPVSSQFISAILMAAPLAAQDVMIEVVGELPSRPYVRMTIEVMRAFGVSVIDDELRRFIVPAGQPYRRADYEIEPDASTASYCFAAAALTGGRVTVEGLGGESIQGDGGFVDVLEKMGCTVQRGPRELTVRGPADGRLRGVDVDLSDMPDVAQTLAVVAAFADGPTRIRHVANLRVKETDRLHALSRELCKIGTATEIHEDGLTIRPDATPRPSAIKTYNDHRMAMSFALAGLRLDGIVIEGSACVSKTFPGFFELWDSLAD